MASKAVASAPNFIVKLLRHRTHHHHFHQPNRLATTPFPFATRTFCTPPPPPRGSPKPRHHDRNPFLRRGEIGACRVEKTENECYMRVDVPGVAEEEMKVWAESGVIYFYAEGSKLSQYNYDGRVFGGSIRFNPDSYDSDGIKTEVKNGVLWLALPRLKN
ncbi:hypothetical protein U1Q18_019398 [Sarracenia purpurea var. burkii]